MPHLPDALFALRRFGNGRPHLSMADQSKPHLASVLLNPVLAELYRHPFRIRRPATLSAPVVLASPHSGRFYPDSFVAASLIAPPLLRRSEDAYADLLFDGVCERVPMLAAEFPRAFVDVNRRPEELDADMFDEPPKGQIEVSAHVTAGFGVIPRIVREGAVINRYLLSPVDVEERMAKLYRPYHSALAELMRKTRQRFGCAVLIDCHTMPGAPRQADIVLGDRHGASAPGALVERAESCFAAQGFTVARNTPFAGGHSTALYARAAEGFYALQIEVSRPLYLDEETVAPYPRFEAVRARIGAAMSTLLDFVATVFNPPCS
jgi:N-formylglutamate amidohydrolase